MDIDTFKPKKHNVSISYHHFMHDSSKGEFVFLKRIIT